MNTKLLLLSFAGLLSLNQMGSSELQARTTTRLDQGWRFPATSVGWYRYTFDVPQEMLGQHVELQFDGIFRDAIVWVNGFYMGNEPSGYATQVYDVTDYLNYGQEGKNVICVRADASLEEGWFYEGAGIYRDVWLHSSPMVHTTTFGTFVHSTLSADLSEATMTIEVKVQNSSTHKQEASVVNVLLDEQRLLSRMIERDRNHPSIILWSDGNEEWGLENNQQGKRVAASMREYTHRLDPTRLVCMANAGSRCLCAHLCDRKYRTTFLFAPDCSLMS